MAFQGSIPAWMVYSPQTLTRPTYDIVARNYSHYRIPRPPVAEEGGSPPGQICWGTVGEMPAAEPAPTVGFTVKSEEWTETSRISQIVRVENPDDPSQYVMEDRPTQVKFNTTSLNPRSGPNTASKPAKGMSDYTPEELGGFGEPNPISVGGAAVLHFMEPAVGYGPPGSGFEEPGPGHHGPGE